MLDTIPGCDALVADPLRRRRDVARHLPGSNTPCMSDFTYTSASAARLVRVKLAPMDALQRALGVTRVARVTGLDRAGVEVACAVRPGGHVLQVTNGKGESWEAARASALSEAAGADYDAGDVNFQELVEKIGDEGKAAEGDEGLGHSAEYGAQSSA